MGYDIWLMSHTVVWWISFIGMISTCHVISCYIWKIHKMFYKYLQNLKQFHGILLVLIPEPVNAAIHPVVDVQGKKASSDDGNITRVADVTVEWNAVSLCVTVAASTDNQYAAVTERTGDAYLRYVLTLHLLHLGDNHPGGRKYERDSRPGWRRGM